MQKHIKQCKFYMYNVFSTVQVLFLVCISWVPGYTQLSWCFASVVQLVFAVCTLDISINVNVSKQVSVSAFVTGESILKQLEHSLSISMCDSLLWRCPFQLLPKRTLALVHLLTCAFFVVSSYLFQLSFLVPILPDSQARY